MDEAASAGSGICLMMILVTVGWLELEEGEAAVVAMTAGGTGCGLMAPVRERVVTCGKSMMMLDVQMLVMVFSSGL